MIIIADSGSTKTDWCIIKDSRRIDISTSGMNPMVLSDTDLDAVLQNELLPSMLHEGFDTDIFSYSGGAVHIYYYGAGCTEVCSPRIDASLHKIFGHSANIETNSDLLAAARALFGKDAGIACILGTGSNSCVYDGCKIVNNVPALGYILGDEGSGAVLGKMFLNAIFKERVSKSLRDEYLSVNSFTMADVINRVYRGTAPNRFLASVSLFVAQHIDEDCVRDIVVENFRAFFRNNISRYGRSDLKIGVVGSIAYVYKDILYTVAQEEHLSLYKILKSPMENLLSFHTR